MAANSRLFKTTALQWVEARPSRRVYTQKKTNPIRIGYTERSDKPSFSKEGLGGLYKSVAAHSRLFKSGLDLAFLYNKKARSLQTWLKEAATYSPTTKCSTIGVSELNFSVRNGKRWDLAAITTLISS